MAKKKFNLDKDALYKKLMPSNTAEPGEEAAEGTAAMASISETSRYVSEQLLSSPTAAQEAVDTPAQQLSAAASGSQTAEMAIQSANVQVQPDAAMQPINEDAAAQEELQQTDPSASPAAATSETAEAFFPEQSTAADNDSTGTIEGGAAAVTDTAEVSAPPAAAVFEERNAIPEEKAPHPEPAEDTDEAAGTQSDHMAEHAVEENIIPSMHMDTPSQACEHNEIEEAATTPEAAADTSLIEETSLNRPELDAVSAFSSDSFSDHELPFSENDASLLPEPDAAQTLSSDSFSERELPFSEDGALSLSEPDAASALSSDLELKRDASETEDDPSIKETDSEISSDPLESAAPDQVEAPNHTDNGTAELPPSAAHTTPRILKDRTELDLKQFSLLMPVNLTEKIVRSHISMILRDHGICTCSRCQMDATSIALNKITTKYISWFSSDQALSDFYYKTHFAEIMSAMLLACSIVKNAPRHEEQYQVPEKNLRVHNMIEDLVAAQIKKMLPSYDGCCCDHCLSDIAALMLNHIPAKYTITTEGKLFAKLVLMEQQYHVDMTTQFIKASHIVQTAPNH